MKLIEKDLEFDFTQALSVKKFDDDKSHGLSHCMKAVDFIVETEKATLFIEVKDPQNPKYPTEKNIDMLKLIISNSSKPGDIVLDAFCGSATTLVVADELGRRWIGIDSSREAISVAAKRLRGYKLLTLAGSKEGSE